MLLNINLKSSMVMCQLTTNLFSLLPFTNSNVPAKGNYLLFSSSTKLFGLCSLFTLFSIHFSVFKSVEFSQKIFYVGMGGILPSKIKQSTILIMRTKDFVKWYKNRSSYLLLSSVRNTLGLSTAVLRNGRMETGI